MLRKPFLVLTSLLLLACASSLIAQKRLPQLIESSFNQYLWIILSNKVLAVVHQQQRTLFNTLSNEFLQ